MREFKFIVTPKGHVKRFYKIWAPDYNRALTKLFRNCDGIAYNFELYYEATLGGYTNE